MSTAPSVASPRWPLIITLGLIALAQPGIRTMAGQLGVDVPALMPVALTLLVTVVWVAAVGLTDTAQPVLTLVTVGLVYMVASLGLGGILSPILDGRLAGSLADSLAIVPFILATVAWGLISGVLALAVQHVRTSRWAARIGGPLGAGGHGGRSPSPGGAQGSEGRGDQELHSAQ